jgi:membrane-associated protein
MSHESSGSLNVWILLALFPAAALTGDVTNYHIGKWLGRRLFRNEKSRVFSRKNLERTHAFFERHGMKTIIIARFVPVVRTMAPFVAGMGYMSFGRFIRYSIAGALLWTFLCVGVGYLFGGLPWVKQNFHYAVMATVLITIIPATVELVRHRLRVRAARKAQG